MVLYVCNVCDNFFIWKSFFHFTYQSQFPLPPIFYLPSSPHPIHFWEGDKAPFEESTSLAYQVEVGPSTSHPTRHQGWEKNSTTGNRLQKASSCTKDKSWCHCQWPHKLSKSHNCHPHSGGLVRSHAGSPVVRPESVSSHELRSLWVSPSWSCPLCSYNLSSFASTRLRELHKVLSCGSLHLLPLVLDEGYQFPWSSTHGDRATTDLPARKHGVNHHHSFGSSCKHREEV